MPVPPKFEVTSIASGDGAVELRVEGEADASVWRLFHQELDLAVDTGRDLLVDFSGCEFLDSSALAALVFAEAKLAKKGLRLVSYGGGPQLLRLFEVTGLDEAVIVAQNREAAVALLAEG